MSDSLVELVFCYVPRRNARHQLGGLVSAANNAYPGKAHPSTDIKGLFGALIDSGRVDLLRSEHHDHEVVKSVFVTVAQFRIIMTDELNHHATLQATGGTAVDLVARPELLVTNFARHAHEEWAINLRKEGIPTCVVINGHGSDRRKAIPVTHRKQGISIN